MYRIFKQFCVPIFCVSILRSEVHKTVRTICFPLVESRIEFWNVASIQEKFFYLYFLERVKLVEKE